MSASKKSKKIIKKDNKWYFITLAKLSNLPRFTHSKKEPIENKKRDYFLESA